MTDSNAIARAFIRHSHGPRTFDLLLRYRTQAVGELGRLLRLFAELRGAPAAPPPLAAARIEGAANDNRPTAAAVPRRPLGPHLES